ncbi:hypothetical protein HD806DRAFT_486266 [Xylariaceae sp. AK1471]|nr:hypothetical protein HD806DRAFT_486266 [Xylariaceae sp. AK1471]
MAPTPELAISCHCGATKQTVRLRTQSSSEPREINLCHCAACRHNTGLLSVSYAVIERPDSIQGLVEYQSTTETIARLFCRTCGCHIFWRLWRAAKDNDNSKLADDAPHAVERLWAVSTGVIIGYHGETEEESSEGNSEVLMRYAKHINTGGTKDGGLSPFIRRVGSSQELEVVENWGTPLEKLKDSDLEASSRSEGKIDGGEEVLNAFCHCKTVQFHITRPNAASKFPRSNFPDLMVPYHTDSPQIQNPEDKKWWLRPDLNYRSEESDTASAEDVELRRYLAGTCACRSCRLTSGFEIQTWAFVPRANVFFHIRHAPRDSPTSPSLTSQSMQEVNATISTIPLDFTTLPSNILTSYESSQGVRREFCARCGATVFWRDRWRPELLDVSVGLLDADEGARAETWLDWWTGRVSFAEDAGNGRTGETARRAKCLIDSLEEGLRKWREEKKEGS